MRIHRLVLRNYRAIREYRLELPESGVVVIEGENEIGKSSIAEALWLVFEVPDSSDSERVRSIKPVDRDAATEIEIEASTGPYRFVYAKRFHRGARTELAIEAPRPEHLTGREAHDRVTAILRETTDTALWAALRLLQGEALNEVSLSGHLSLAAALDEAASAKLGGEREQSLIERAHKEFLLYFTETGRENRDFNALRNAFDQREREARSLANDLASLEAMADRYADLESGVSRLSAARTVAEAELERVRQRAEERRRLEDAAANLETQRKLALTERDSLEEEVARRKQLAVRLVALHDQLAALGPQRESTAVQAHRARAELETAEREAREAEERVQERRAAARVAEADFSYHQERLQVEQMAERVTRVADNQLQLRDLAGQLNTIRVNHRVIEELEGLQREYERAELRLEAEGAAIEVTSPEPIDIALDGKPARAARGEPFAAQVLGEATLSLPGGIEVRIQAGQGAKELGERVAEAKRRLEARLAEAGADSITGARELETQRRSAMERRTGLERQVAADLRDQTAESLAAKLERSRERVQRYEQDRSGGVPMPASLEAAREGKDRAGALADEVETTERAARKRLAEALAAHSDCGDGLERLERQISGLEQELAETESSLHDLVERKADADLEQDLSAARDTADRVERELGAARASLQSFPEVSSALSDAQAGYRRADEALRHAESERAEVRGALQLAGETGLHQQLQDAQSALAATGAELASFSARATAARLLYETLKRHREVARRAYALPLQDKVQELGRTVFGPSFAVELDQDLRIARRTLDGVTLEFARLSVGAREQLGILLRLACASLVSKSGGVPLVLDDVLGWSDPKRLARIGDVLALAARETQVLVLTCTPERFAGVTPATVISLPAGTVRRQDGEPAALPVTRAAAPRRASPARPPTEQAALDLFGETPSPTRR